MNAAVNDPNNPLISILIYDYHGEHLERCFNSILSQNILTNIEIIFIDNASTDGSWNIAIEYARNYDGVITLKRNKRSNVKDNRDNRDCTPIKNNHYYCRRLSNGKYYVVLTENEVFLPEYLQQCVRVMEFDPFTSFEMIRRNVVFSGSLPNITKQPLVSILIFNYNYGCYLRQCFESVYSQSYDHFEIIFSDNASKDNSWDIAVEYSDKYPGSMTLIRNRKNFGPNLNLENCYDNISGKYFCVLCSDDTIEPEFISRCVHAMESYPKTGFAITHRTIIDEHDAYSLEPSFYNKSCIIPGPEQAAVYMMAAVNPSISQVMYHYEKALPYMPTQNLLTRWFSQRLLDFNICCEFDVAYIDEPLLLNRVHSNNESLDLSNNLVEVFGQYILAHQFVEIAKPKENMTKAIARLPDALEKVGKLCLRYCVWALGKGDETTALKYFHLSLSIVPNIIKEPTFIKLNEYWTAAVSQKSHIIKSLQRTANVTTRKISYDPPPGSIPI